VDGAAGAGCAGTPKVCIWNWIAFVPGASAPAVANGLVFVGSSAGGVVEAFDAKGLDHCPVGAHVCLPLWTSNVNGAAASVEVWDGRVYVGSTDGTVTVFGLP